MLGLRLASARKRLGLSQVQLAVAMGPRYDQSMISHVEAGRSKLAVDGLTTAALVLGVSIDYLLGLTDNPSPAMSLTPDTSTFVPDPPDIVRVPLVATATGMETPYDLTVKDRLPFRRQWLEDRRIDPENCQLMTVRGDWMAPTLPDKCTILVDLRRDEFRDDRIFVVETSTPIGPVPTKSPVATRIVWHDPINNWAYVSDQTKDAPMRFFDEPTIIGEVRWVERFL